VGVLIAEPPKDTRLDSRATVKSAEDKLGKTDTETVRRLLVGIKKLQQEGKLEAAARQAADLANRAANEPAAQAANRIATTAGRIASGRQLEDDQERRTAGSLAQVERARSLPAGEIEYPKDWKPGVRKRSAETVPTTAQERAVLRALDSPISVQFRNTRFQDVIDYIQDRTGQTIILDNRALEEAGVSYDSPVNLTLKGVSLRFVLLKVLRDLGLTYVVKDEAIQVVSPRQAAEMMSVRVYYVGDLAATPWQAAYLIDLIQSTIAPESWRVNGGLGTIVYDPVRQALIIKQSAEFHPVLSSGLP
jgi:hypothetical protein